MTAALLNDVTTTPVDASSGESGVDETSALFRKLSDAMAERNGEGRVDADAFVGIENPSSVSVLVLLKRQASSPRFGMGVDENFSNAARFRSSHHAGAEAWAARCAANDAGSNEPVADETVSTEDVADM